MAFKMKGNPMQRNFSIGSKLKINKGDDKGNPSSAFQKHDGKKYEDAGFMDSHFPSGAPRSAAKMVDYSLKPDTIDRMQSAKESESKVKSTAEMYTSALKKDKLESRREKQDIKRTARRNVKSQKSASFYQGKKKTKSNVQDIKRKKRRDLQDVRRAGKTDKKTTRAMAAGVSEAAAEKTTKRVIR